MGQNRQKSLEEPWSQPQPTSRANSSVSQPVLPFPFRLRPRTPPAPNASSGRGVRTAHTNKTPARILLQLHGPGTRVTCHLDIMTRLPPSPPRLRLPSHGLVLRPAPRASSLCADATPNRENPDRPQPHVSPIPRACCTPPSVRRDARPAPPQAPCRRPMVKPLR